MINEIKKLYKAQNELKDTKTTNWAQGIQTAERKEEDDAQSERWIQ
jgi:hypothetical protein